MESVEEISVASVDTEAAAPDQDERPQGSYPEHVEQEFADIAGDDAAAPEEEPSEPCTIEGLTKAIRKQPLHKHIYRRILAWLEDEATTQEAEEFISSLPEFAYSLQPQGRFLLVLERAGGIERVGRLEVDDDPASGSIDEAALSLASDAAFGDAPAAPSPQPSDEASSDTEPEDAEGTPAPEDDLRGIVWKTTALGEEYLAATRPSDKFNALLSAEPERKAGYLLVMSALEGGPKKLNEIVAELERRKEGDPSVGSTHPSVFLDRLEAAGIITWDESWALTEDGRSCLAEFQDDSIS